MKELIKARHLNFNRILIVKILGARLAEDVVPLHLIRKNLQEFAKLPLSLREFNLQLKLIFSSTLEQPLDSRELAVFYEIESLGRGNTATRRCRSTRWIGYHPRGVIRPRKGRYISPQRASNASDVGGWDYSQAVHPGGVDFLTIIYFLRIPPILRRLRSNLREPSRQEFQLVIMKELIKARHLNFNRILIAKILGARLAEDVVPLHLYRKNLQEYAETSHVRIEKKPRRGWLPIE